MVDLKCRTTHQYTTIIKLSIHYGGMKYFFCFLLQSTILTKFFDKYYFPSNDSSEQVLNNETEILNIPRIH